MTRGAGAPLAGRVGTPPAAPLARHCWVVDAPGQPGRWPGLLVEWRQDPQGWSGRVVHVVPEPGGGGQRVLERWLPARCLQPVR